MTNITSLFPAFAFFRHCVIVCSVYDSRRSQFMWLNHFCTLLINMCATGIWIPLSIHLYTCPGRLSVTDMNGVVSALEMERSREVGLIWHTCSAKEIQTSSWMGGGPCWVKGGRGFNAELHHMAWSWNFLPTSLYIEATARAARDGSSWSPTHWMTCSLGLTLLHFSLIEAAVMLCRAVWRESRADWVGLGTLKNIYFSLQNQ